MKRLLSVFFSLFVLFATLASASFAQSGAADPYKNVLDRLESILTLAIPEFRYHAERLGVQSPGPTRRSAGDRRPYADCDALMDSCETV